MKNIKYLIDRLIIIYRKNKEVANYLVFGFLTTFINLIVYYILTNSFLNVENELELQIANVIAWIVAVVFAYVTNRKFVFDSKNKNKIKEIRDFFFARILTLFVDMIVMHLGVNILMFNDKIIKIFSQIIVIVSNYVLSKLFVFKKDN